MSEEYTWIDYAIGGLKNNMQQGHFHPLDKKGRDKYKDKYLIYDLDSKGWVESIKLYSKRTRVRVRAYIFRNKQSVQKYMHRHKRTKQQFLVPEKFLFPALDRPTGCGVIYVSPKLWEEGSTLNNFLR